MTCPALRRIVSLTLAVAVVALGTIASTATAGANATAGAKAATAGDRARGLEWAGMALDSTGACPGAYRMTSADGRVDCTHGPDPAPPGVDVTRHRNSEELVAGTSQGSVAASGSTVPCYGDGASGKRVQAVYAYADDVPDRSATMVDLIAGWAGTVDGIFNDSATKTGGVRHVRWVADAGCRLSVIVVRLVATGDDNFSNTINELRSAGLNRTDRKYIMWVDTNIYCGIADLRIDDSLGTANANEGGPSYARVDNGCWGFQNSVEAHELMHTIGGVQYSAPHSTGAGHCTDEQDRMCYTDSQSTVLTYPCVWEHERLFDCGDDDYFHTNPLQGSYLAGHWNSAMSSYLERAAPSSDPVPPPPAPTASTTWSGSLGRKATSASYTVATGTGTVDLTLNFTRAKSLTLTVKRADGTIVVQKVGPSTISLAASVASGDQTFVVSSGGASASFTLTATYPSP